jgi:hypothetical protein
MPDRPQVPRIAQLLGPAIDAMVAARPSILPHINNGAGRWADLVAGWEAQCALLVRQIASEVAAARLRIATGDALTSLAASDFQTNRNPGATFAVGRAVISRTGAMPGGIIPQGFRFRRPSVTTYTPQVASAAYIATRDVSWPDSVSAISVPITASLAGAAANAPYYDADNTAGGPGLLELGDTAFDATAAVTAWEAAGGSDGEGDEDLRRQAAAYATGRYGPTLGAIVAGALSGIGVHRAAVFDVAQTSTGAAAAYTGVAVADASWASGYGGLPSGSTLGVWEGLVGQVIADSYQGVGGQVLVTGVANTRIRLDASFLLRSGDDLKDTSAIDAAVLAAARSYFDDRPDWYTWTAKGLRAWLSRAHEKILSCTSVTVRALAGNGALAEPPTKPIFTATGIAATHYALASNGVTPVYAAAT